MDEILSSPVFYNQSDEESFVDFSTENSLTANVSIDLLLIYLNKTEHYNESQQNTTLDIPDWREAYKPVLDLLMLFILIVVMLSMGCEITWRKLYDHVKRPIGLCIGIFSQFGIMPLSAYFILRITSIQGLHATGVLLISCCPGGVLSNTFTYFCEGDLGLSVAMTCASTVMAMGMMPLNIWLYGRYFESDGLVIPYNKMAMSLISVTSPVIVGMLLKWKLPRIASFTTKLGSYGGILIMFVCIIMEVLLFPNMFTGVSAKLYAVILSLPIIGLTLGYALASLLKQNKNVRKTISIECGVQNVPVALTIIAMSFPLEMQEDIVLLPWLYGFAMMTGCTIICFTYHLCKRYSQKSDDAPKDDIIMKQVPLFDEEQKRLDYI